MGTKKEAIARKAAWAKALADGRVVRYNGGMSFKSWPTVQQAQDDVRAINTFGAGDAAIVSVPCPLCGRTSAQAEAIDHSCCRDAGK